MSYSKVYFIGIGGIGMSAIARWCKFRGYEVSGYDRTPSELTRALESEGMDVHYEDNPSLIPSELDDTLVVYTPAIPEDMAELVYVRSKGYKIVKRARMLGELSNNQTCLAVAGTHGKTTTSTLVAHILTESGKGCSAFLGGISKNYDTNMLMSHTPTMVAEADEFDRSFLQLHPAIAAITSMDADHLDIYSDHAHLQVAFRQFASQVSETLILKHELPISYTDTDAKIFSYHLDNTAADFHAKELRLQADGHYCYDLVYPGGVLSDIRVGALGWINVENSIAAAAMCLCYGIDAQLVRKAIGSFKGVKRRLDVQLCKENLVYIDDYAHHPAELRSAISSVRQIFPNRKICAVFQPHLYTRTRDFAEEFALALSQLDKCILLDIYPARELPIEGVNSELLLERLTCPEKVLLHKENLLEYLAQEPLEVLLTLGAGDIDRLVIPIRDLLESRELGD